MRLLARLSVLALPVLVAACTTMPSGPGVMVLPGTGMSFDRFRADDYECRNYALAGIGGVTPTEAAQQSGVGSAVVGTVVGAAAGAAIGGHEGAAVGAGTGLVVGSLAGTEAAQVSGYELQRRYDTAYIQCMYARGHRVPVSGRLYRESPPPAYSPPPPGAPPPPPGMPPPPPPGLR